MKLLAHSRSGGPRRKGTVVVVFAVSLTAILAVVALALDGGMLIDKRRQVQSTADAAALAAANELYANWWTTSATYGPLFKGLDPDGKAQAAAKAAAKANGYEDGVNGCTVTVNIPPLSGPFAGQACHTEVIITTSQQQYFSRMFGSNTVTYGARAVSRGRRGGINNAIICLDPTGKGALNAGGNGGISVTGAPIQVNSNDSEAMIANGNGTMTAPQFLIAGNPGVSTPGGGTFSGTVVPNSPPIPDPLASLAVPNPANMTIQDHNGVHNTGNKTLNLDPGVYIGGITATGGTINLAPGIYYMQGGGFNISGQANVTGNGVMIYNAPQSNSDKIDISGQGSIVLSPPTNGPYQGILFFQDRTSTAPVNVSGSNGTTLTLTGTFYSASATLTVTGNGNQQTIGSQYISYDLVLSGNGTYNCSWTPDITPGTREVLLVQ